MPPPSTSNTKTVTKDVAPHLTAALLTTLCARPVEIFTVRDLAQLNDAINRLSRGHDPDTVIGDLLT